MLTVTLANATTLNKIVQKWRPFPSPLFSNQGKVSPMTKHHATKLYRGSRATAPGLPSAVDREEWSPSLRQKKRHPNKHWTDDWVVPTAGLGDIVKTELPHLCWKSKPRRPHDNRWRFTLPWVFWKSFIKHTRSHGADVTNSEDNGPRSFHLPA